MGTDKDSQELAKDRTDWAEDRTLMANERTFAGWMRTGMAAMAIGLGFRALFRATEMEILAKSTALLFIFIGVLIFIQAYRKSASILHRLSAHTAEPVKPTQMALVAGLFSLGGVILAILIWFL